MSSSAPSGKPSRLRSSLALTAVVLAAGATLLLGRSSEPHGVTPAAKRGRPRELAIHLLNGQPWQLSQQRGHVVLLNLWATWCGPCRSETPALVRLNTDLAAQGFRVVGLSLDTVPDRDAQVRSFEKTYRVNYPMAFPDLMSQVEAGLEGIPTTLLFDRQGRAAAVYVGAIREPAVRADVTHLLSEPYVPEPAYASLRQK